MDLRVFGDHDAKVLAQAERCLSTEEGSVGSLSADGHFGYSAPIGLSWALREHVSPAAVGYDIGCGNLAVETGLKAVDLRGDLPRLMDRIYAEVSFGMGRADGTAGDHPVIDDIRDSPLDFQRELAKTAAKQLGTVGAGNHYVDLFEDERGVVWIGVHFGSRGFGHKTATHFLNLAARENGHEYREGGGEMEAPPDLLHVRSQAGQAYLAAMRLAGRYAYAGREVVVEQVLGILGAPSLEAIRSAGGEVVHNHHNFAWEEEHDVGHGAEPFYVVRKGATPAFPGQRGFVGATMGEPSVILEGVAGDRSQTALHSTVHGAGRAMSRTAAAGRTRKRWACPACGWMQPPRTAKPKTCRQCGEARLTKRWVKEREGAIDWVGVLRDLDAKGIELRGANAEEAPGAYKRLPEVLAHHEGTVRVLNTLKPLGVAMAAGDTVDPYKD
jgi:tRNA-splicing ligase RtcB